MRLLAGCSPSYNWESLTNKKRTEASKAAAFYGLTWPPIVFPTLSIDNTEYTNFLPDSKIGVPGKTAVILTKEGVLPDEPQFGKNWTEFRLFIRKDESLSLEQLREDFAIGLKALGAFDQYFTRGELLKACLAEKMSRLRGRGKGLTLPKNWEKNLTAWDGEMPSTTKRKRGSHNRDWKKDGSAIDMAARQILSAFRICGVNPLAFAEQNEKDRKAAIKGRKKLALSICAMKKAGHIK
jgi:hypothetical protein